MIANPTRFELCKASAAVAGSMIGEIGAFGGAILPNALAYSKTHTGSYASGFIAFAGLCATILIVLRIVQRHWVGKWTTAGGRAITADRPTTDNGGAMGLPDPI